MTKSQQLASRGVHDLRGMLDGHCLLLNYIPHLAFQQSENKMYLCSNVSVQTARVPTFVLQMSLFSVQFFKHHL